MVALENINVLQQNGFEIDVDAEASVGQGSKLKLTAQPVSKNTTFDMKGALSNNNSLCGLLFSHDEFRLFSPCHRFRRNHSFDA